MPCIVDNKLQTLVEDFRGSAPNYKKYTGGCTREHAAAVLGLPQRSSLYSSNAVDLDNARGTGIVAEEIVQRCSNKGVSPMPKITTVDPAPNMVDFARQKFPSQDHIFRLIPEGHVGLLHLNTARIGSDRYQTPRRA